MHEELNVRFVPINLGILVNKPFNGTRGIKICSCGVKVVISSVRQILQSVAVVTCDVTEGILGFQRRGRVRNPSSTAHQGEVLGCEKVGGNAVHELHLE